MRKAFDQVADAQSRLSKAGRARARLPRICPKNRGEGAQQTRIAALGRAERLGQGSEIEKDRHGACASRLEAEELAASGIADRTLFDGAPSK